MSTAAVGRWVPRRAVLVLVPDEATPTTPPRPITELIACPTCRARVHETCRTTSGHTTTPHGSRLAPRLCPCGSALAPRRRFCDFCRDEVNRANKRDHLRRKRARAPRTKDAA